MFHEHSIPIIQKADGLAKKGDLINSYKMLRDLPFSDFCDLMMKVPSEYDSLGKIIPRLPSDDIQKNWTGHHGYPLMVKSSAIIRLFQNLRLRITGQDLGGKILDYGCGWGRLLRLMYYFTDPEFTFGIDPMQKSLKICMENGLKSNFALCESIPSSIPFHQIKFDFIYAYSVLTHTAEVVTQSILRVVRSHITETGLFIVTIRPIEFWDLRKSTVGSEQVSKIKTLHRDRGYAFLPLSLDGKPSDTYGEASISFEYFTELAEKEKWRIACFDSDYQEPYQIMVALVPL